MIIDLGNMKEIQNDRNVSGAVISKQRARLDARIHARHSLRINQFELEEELITHLTDIAIYLYGLKKPELYTDVLNVRDELMSEIDGVANAQEYVGTKTIKLFPTGVSG